LDFSFQILDQYLVFISFENDVGFYFTSPFLSIFSTSSPT
jgi:hypothetical protein